MVEIFSGGLGRLSQGVGDRLQRTNIIFFLAHEIIPKYRRKGITYGNFFVIIDPKMTNLAGQDLWQRGGDSSGLWVVSLQ